MLVLSADFLASASANDQLPAPIYAEVAFAGRSNVGKSSLINTLLQRKKLVRTSSTPGCTRGINVFRVGVRVPGEPSVDGIFDCVDLPGYGYAKRSKAERKKWGPLIEEFLATRVGLRAVVVIIDARRGLMEDDEDLVEFLKAINRRVVLVVTKLDKLPRNQHKPRLKEIQQKAKVRVFGFSSANAFGREELFGHLLKVCSIEAANTVDASCES